MELANRPFGCQARPWLQEMGIETFTAELPNVMRTISETGFSGFETALAVLPLNDPGQFAAWRHAANDLRLAAAHTGGAWWEPDKRDSIPELLVQIAKLPELGCDQVMLSIGAGVVDLSDDELATMAGTLAELARNAADIGVQIAVHNHAAELSAEARVLTTLMDVAARSGLKLGADLGWVAHADVDPMTFIDEFGQHLAYLHIRDVIFGTGQTGFIEVGHGEMDWPGIVAALDRVGYSGWLVAESEYNEFWRGAQIPKLTATLQFAGMRSHLSSANL